MLGFFHLFVKYWRRECYQLYSLFLIIQSLTENWEQWSGKLSRNSVSHQQQKVNLFLLYVILLSFNTCIILFLNYWLFITSDILCCFVLLFYKLVIGFQFLKRNRCNYWHRWYSIVEKLSKNYATTKKIEFTILLCVSNVGVRGPYHFWILGRHISMNRKLVWIQVKGSLQDTTKHFNFVTCLSLSHLLYHILCLRDDKPLLTTSLRRDVMGLLIGLLSTWVMRKKHQPHKLGKETITTTKVPCRW